VKLNRIAGRTVRCAAVAALAVATFALAPSALRAQVGHSPDHSPYEDLSTTMSLTAFGGEFHGHHDPAGVAPQSGAMYGVQWDWRATGPLSLNADVASVASTRHLINPAKAAKDRDLGTVSRPLYMANAGFAVALPGARTWHHLAPQLGMGAEVVSDLHSAPDSGGVKFGTRFAFTPEIGVRWLGSGRSRFGARLDFTDHLYSIGYPITLYQNAVNDPVLDASVTRTQWINNPALTFGISYLFGGR